MFDVGFSELVVIALVALIVIGPERLPKVARTAGHLLGRLQRYVNDVKADINREMQLEELKKLQSQVAEQVKSLENTASQQAREVETSLNQAIAPPAVDAGKEAAVSPTPEQQTLALTPEASPLIADNAAATAAMPSQLPASSVQPAEQPKA
jgi:sec-independent protein translocase protein TatB